MSEEYYTLVGREPMPIGDDLMRWAEESRTGGDSWRVARDEVRGAVLSTVFFGRALETPGDHLCMMGMKPAFDHEEDEDRVLLFETLVMGGLRDGEVARYATWEEAEEGHLEILKTLLDDVYYGEET